MGYFLNPIVNVIIGVIVFREKISKLQTLSVGIVSFAILYNTISFNSFPWVTVLLAFSFAFYAMFRKLSKISPVHGYFMETVFNLPLAIIYLAYLYSISKNSFTLSDPVIDLWFVAMAIITTAALVLYTSSLKYLKISTVGMLFYITPTGLILIGTVLYDQPLDIKTIITFCLIWTALIIFSYESYKANLKENKLCLAKK
jgi:chloramphenicol-sensitive protein RarD